MPSRECSRGAGNTQRALSRGVGPEPVALAGVALGSAGHHGGIPSLEALMLSGRWQRCFRQRAGAQPAGGVGQIH
eukprot:461933-Alexandrium_andersonii.AAC.1